jgi:hypothetical protein
MLDDAKVFFVIYSPACAAFAMIVDDLSSFRSRRVSVFELECPMSHSTNSSAAPAESASQISALLNAGIIGAAVGAGAMFLVMYYYGYRASDAVVPVAPPQPDPASVVAVPLPGMGGPQNKRQLTSLVGRMELLTRDNLDLHVVLSADQAEKIAVRLKQLDEIARMSDADAELECQQLEELLTPEQRAILDTIGMPRGSGMMPPGFGEFDENPFALEVNHSRLRDLLGRLAPATADDAAAATADVTSSP